MWSRQRPSALPLTGGSCLSRGEQNQTCGPAVDATKLLPMASSSHQHGLMTTFSAQYRVKSCTSHPSRSQHNLADIANRVRAGISEVRNPAGARKFFSPSKLSTRLLSPPTMGNEVLGRVVNFTTHLHPVPRSRINGAITLFPLYAFRNRGNFSFFTLKIYPPLKSII